MRYEYAPNNQRCHATADTRVAYLGLTMMRVCWDHADQMMRELRDRHAADGHADEATEGYARFQKDMARQKAAGRGLN